MGAYEDEVEAFHRARVERLKSAEGWLSLVAKSFLEPGVTLAIGSGVACDVRLPRGPEKIGTITLEDGIVRFVAERGVATIDGADAAQVKARELRTDAAGAPDRVRIGTMTLDVMQRGDTFAVRVRDPEAPSRVGLGRIDRYAIDPAWRVRARFVPAASPVREWVDFGSGIADEMISPGTLEMDTPDGPLVLRALYEDAQRKRLFVLFRDGTSGVESYGLGRFLYAPLPDKDVVEIDFNRAMLPGCAFNELATCPIPSPQNRTRVHVRAGEKNYEPPEIAD